MTKTASTETIESPEEEAQARKEIRCPVISVEKSAGPNNTPGDDWYRYEIDTPGSPIVGYRRGTKNEILRHLEEATFKIEERLNTRKPKKKK